MGRGNAILSASGLVLALALPSWAQEVRRQLPTQAITLSGTVETIDQFRRMLTPKSLAATNDPRNLLAILQSRPRPDAK